MTAKKTNYIKGPYERHGHCINYQDGRTYQTWLGMVKRCYNTKTFKYPIYGGRGIIVCDRWRHSFINFLADMREKPEGLTIERIDNNGNYEPTNYRWATNKEQSRNRRDNCFITYKGQIKCLTEWAEYTNIKMHTLRARLRLGWSKYRSFTQPVRRKVQEKEVKP